MLFKNYEVKKRLDFYNFTFKIARFQEDICKANLLSNSSKNILVSMKKCSTEVFSLEFITRRIWLQYVFASEKFIKYNNIFKSTP
jgi:hypothetical protein